MKSLDEVIEIFVAKLNVLATKKGKFGGSVAKESDDISKIVSTLMVAKYYDGLLAAIQRPRTDMPPEFPPQEPFTS